MRRTCFGYSWNTSREGKHGSILVVRKADEDMELAKNSNTHREPSFVLREHVYCAMESDTSAGIPALEISPSAASNRACTFSSKRSFASRAGAADDRRIEIVLHKAIMSAL